jgi:hypothetical protein
MPVQDHDDEERPEAEDRWDPGAMVGGTVYARVMRTAYPGEYRSLREVLFVNKDASATVTVYVNGSVLRTVQPNSSLTVDDLADGAILAYTANASANIASGDFYAVERPRGQGISGTRVKAGF